jgi:hypothetical protein
MPSLFRLVGICAVLGAVAYAALLSLANMVEPRQHEIVTTIPLHPKLPAATAPPAGVRTKTAATVTNSPDELFDKLQSLPLVR